MFPKISISPRARGYVHVLLGDDKEQARTSLYLIAGSIVAAVILVVTRGKISVPVAFIAISVVVILTFYRLVWGFLTFIGMVLTFDQFIPVEFFGSRTVLGVEYFQNLKSLPALSGVGFAVMTPMEIHLFFIIIVWLLQIAFKKRVMLNRIPVSPAAILFFIWLVFAFVNGMRRGGDFLVALWELRALFYMGIMYFFVPQIIQTKKDIRNLIWVCIVAIAIKAFQGIVRFISIGFTLDGYSVLTNHEDPLFFISLLILFLGWKLFGHKDRQRTAIALLIIPMIIGFIVAQRRAAFGSLVISLVTFFLLLPRKEQISFLKPLVPTIVIVGLYLAAFWSSDGSTPLSRPAIFIRSAFYTSEQGAADSYSSNFYREMENYDLAFTIRRLPLEGIGFGNKYDQPITLPAIPFPLKDYIPHNEILWLMVKTGAIGFFLFCFFMTAYMFQAASTFSNLQDPYLKAICIVSIVGILGQIVVSYYDLQLTFYRNMAYLGLIMGLLPCLELADQEEDEKIPVAQPQFINSPL
jgi:hypothetical protein